MKLDPAVTAELSKAFTINLNPGSNSIILTRKDTSSETVTVSIDAGNPQYSDGGDEQQEYNEDAQDEEQQPQTETLFYTTVSVVKPGKPNKLVFECFIGGVSGVDIRNVHYVAASAEPDNLGAKDYSGPIFDELDDTVKSGFDAYLAGLGIDYEFAASAFQLADDKERTEYTAWLGNVAAYLK